MIATIKCQQTGPRYHEHLDATLMRAPAIMASSGREMVKADKSHGHSETEYQSKTQTHNQISDY